MQGQWGAELELVVAVMQAALAPAFLLTAVAGLLNVMTARLARAVDRARELQRSYRDADDRERRWLGAEFDLIIRRKKLIRLAMLLCVGGAVLICLLIALLFIMGLSRLSLAWLIKSLFAGAMGLIAAALMMLLRETRLAASFGELTIAPPD
ncbi:MAG: DUF2721 domain-containing protein [Sphingopyxis sp.]|nr:DUF2721 domain-containing protein [Sphingopyxis sp.]